MLKIREVNWKDTVTIRAVGRNTITAQTLYDAGVSIIDQNAPDTLSLMRSAVKVLFLAYPHLYEFERR